MPALVKSLVQAQRHDHHKFQRPPRLQHQRQRQGQNTSMQFFSVLTITPSGIVSTVQPVLQSKFLMNTSTVASKLLQIFFHIHKVVNFVTSELNFTFKRVIFTINSLKAFS